MQQPKIEVRARDERRRDEVCAKWSTVEGERETAYEVLCGKREREGEKKARWEVEQRESRRKRGKEEDERRGTQQLRGYVCNEDLSKREDQQRGGKSGPCYRGRSEGWMPNTGGEVER